MLIRTTAAAEAGEQKGWRWPAHSYRGSRPNFAHSKLLKWADKTVAGFILLMPLVGKPSHSKDCEPGLSLF